MSFEETPDFHEFLDTQTLYRVQMLRVADKDTRLGQCLQWEFSIHERSDGRPVLDGNDRPIIVTRLTSPRMGPRARARAFVNALFGRELPKDELHVLIQSGQLANQLKSKTALAYITFDDADGNETEFPRINELFPMAAAKKEKLPPPPRSYEEVFDDDDPPGAPPVAGGSDGDLPFR